MAFESDSLNRRTIGPVIASAVVGVVLGVVAVFGVSLFSGQDSVPEGKALSSEEALLGGPEYGTREP
ncbi:DUF2613 domain-containing protein [Corynebacterium spheniscorum]|uniref:DUF2613 domain-containing protein n=1 Tax=Corynebacterium spheniscorum TaxID=185761 RepID=A0A1I2TC56_9CORY|nr:DUF2613 domain-containing protein [Corynebacterium spheniscorum]KAA8719872.1 DUF2613 family protein [Corynebacterium spheniscorum]SFG62398.1 Protein of unknown function [Corynebacterium spheniscorum]